MNNHFIVKLGDFGLTREVNSEDNIKQTKNRKPLPIRWMSPESIKYSDFSVKSDVWSFGILVWEVLTLGSPPYPGFTNDQAIEYITNSFIMQIPDQCPKEMYMFKLFIYCGFQKMD